MARERASYADAGAAGRAAIDRALDAGAPLIAVRVLLVLVREVVLFSRVEDELALAVIVRSTGMDERAVSRGLRWLVDHDVIAWRPGSSPKGGRRTLSSVSFPPALTPGHIDPRSDQPPVDRRPPVDSRGDPRSIRAVTPGHGDPPTEKVPEKTPERHQDSDVEREARRRLDAKKQRGEVIKSETGMLGHLRREVAAEIDNKRRAARAGAACLGESRASLDEAEFRADPQFLALDDELRAIALAAHRASASPMAVAQ